MKDGRGYMQLIRMEVAAGSFSSAPLHLKCLCPLFLEMHLSVFPHCYHLNWTIDSYIDVSFLFDAVLFMHLTHGFSVTLSYSSRRRGTVARRSHSFHCSHAIHRDIYIVGSYRETILIITLALLAFVPSNPR